jgi:hypothetical protein
MASLREPDGEQGVVDGSGRPLTAPKPARPAGWSGAAPADLGQESSPGAWALVWTIVVVKTITIVVTIAAARSWDAGAIMALTTWPWLVVIAVLIAGPALFQYRLRQVRARRAELLRAEWLLEERTSADRPDDASPA